jgi:hypothetical protein
MLPPLRQIVEILEREGYGPRHGWKGYPGP